MARVTVEDCLDHVENRFELALLAAKRARQLTLGQDDPLVPWNNDKPSVVALREFAAGKLNRDIINTIQERIRNQQLHNPIVPEPDVMADDDMTISPGNDLGTEAI